MNKKRIAGFVLALVGLVILFQEATMTGNVTLNSLMGYSSSLKPVGLFLFISGFVFMYLSGRK